MRILVIEDEKPLAFALEKILKQNNHAVDIVHDGEAGLDYAESNIYDVILCDIMLPKQDGFSVVRGLREAGFSTPVLMLTAKTGTQDKILGLDSGADDYLAKPFAMDELLARIRALGRRRGEMLDSQALCFGDLTFVQATMTVSVGEQSYILTAKEGQLLEQLMLHKGMTVPKERLIEKIWGFDSEAEDNHVEVYISFLRKKLKSLASATTIKTVRGIGYCLEN